MTTVYTHIKPFQKRLISVFRQRRAEIGEVGKIGSILNDLLLKQNLFEEALKVYQPTCVFSVEQQAYIEGLLNDVREQLAKALAEREMVVSLLAKLSACQACDGHGEFYTHTGQDDGFYSKCPACDGSGTNKKVEVSS